MTIDGTVGSRRIVTRHLLKNHVLHYILLKEYKTLDGAFNPFVPAYNIPRISVNKFEHNIF